MTIHAQNQEVIRAFARKKPVSRLLVNTPGALGGVGSTTNLAPALDRKSTRLNSSHRL